MSDETKEVIDAHYKDYRLYPTDYVDKLATRNAELAAEVERLRGHEARLREACLDAVGGFQELLKSHVYWTTNRMNNNGDPYSPTHEEREASDAIITLTAALAADGGA